MSEERLREAVGVVGATSLVGSYLLLQLKDAGHPVTAFTRNAVNLTVSDVEWRSFESRSLEADDAPVRGKVFQTLALWICAAPIWVLPEHFELMLSHGVRRLVAISSTSVITKVDSSDPQEKAVSQKLAAAEECVKVWAKKHGVELVLLRPTLIYGNGRDKSIAEIARLINRLGFFPVFGRAMGLRQPIHAKDVAAACYAALMSSAAICGSYAISGGETLPYREMVERVFLALQKKPRLVNIPLIFFKAAVTVFRVFPRYRQWTSAMAERMNRDLVFDHSEATRDFGFNPGLFTLSVGDISSPPLRLDQSTTSFVTK